MGKLTNQIKMIVVKVKKFSKCYKCIQTYIYFIFIYILGGGVGGVSKAKREFRNLLLLSL